MIPSMKVTDHSWADILNSESGQEFGAFLQSLLFPFRPVRIGLYQAFDSRNSLMHKQCGSRNTRRRKAKINESNLYVFGCVN